MRSHRAFSLVEVLISIVVLALGLLGIAAIFPAVVSQQRQATDSVLGASVQNSVTTYLKGSFALNKASKPVLDASGNIIPNVIIPDAQQRGWMLLAGNPAWSPPAAFPGYMDGDFVVPTINTSDPISIDPVTGTVTILGLNGPGTWNPGGTTSNVLPVAERLSPTPFINGSQPLYVWDFAARRVAAGVTPSANNDRLALQDDSVQLVVFIRRIDSGIRKPAGRTVSDVLAGPLAAADRRVPVAEDATTLRPTFDGMGGSTQNYSNIHAVEFGIHTYDLNPTAPLKPRYDRLTLDTAGSFPQLVPYLQQVGQKFVDSWGVVHTVSELVRKKDLDATDPEFDAQSDQVITVRVTPPVDYATFRYLTDNATNPPRLYFTTQIPAAVFSVTVPTLEPGSN